MTNTFVTLPLASITPSLTNPRKSFNAVKLTELAESIKASGVHQPILIRPLPGSRVGETGRWVTHEIIAGERRYRASLQAELETIPALVRELTDEQVLEVQIVENLQRDDLTALEEAEGYEQLIASQPALTAEAIARKIGKSRSYVFGRLKLLDLSVECKAAMRAGEIDASRALLIARIPDTALQTKALNEATRVDYRGEVPSLRVLQHWLQANVMLKLDNAAFNVFASQLVPAAGGCMTCPKRTGASPDMFYDVVGPDLCTDPVCFHAKEDAHRANVLAAAEKRGMKLIDGDDAKKIMPNQYTSYMDGYSPLTQERTDTADGQPTTLGQLLGADPIGAVLIENPYTKELVAAVPTLEAEAVLLARGLVKAVEAKAAKWDDVEAEIKRLKARAQKDILKRFRADAFTQLADTVHSCSDDLSAKMLAPGLLRAWWLRQVDELDNTELAKLFNLELVHPDTKPSQAQHEAQSTQIRLHVQRCDSGKLYQAMVLWMVMDDNPSYFYSDPEQATLFEALASELGVDLDSIESEANDAVQDEYADELKKLKAQLKGTNTTGTPTTCAYRGPNGETWSGRGLMPRWLVVLIENGAEKESFRIVDVPIKTPTTGTPAAQAKGRGGKKPKTSAAQASAQIAAAMQAQEGEYSGADAQGIEGAGEQPVATSAAVASGVAQAVDAADYERAVKLVRDQKKVNVSLVQRSLKIGYNAAARLVEQMEGAGVVSHALADGSRTVVEVTELEGGAA
jgi:ParB/RepB/Spo0J family partition protein